MHELSARLRQVIQEEDRCQRMADRMLPGTPSAEDAEQLTMVKEAARLIRLYFAAVASWRSCLLDLDRRANAGSSHEAGSAASGRARSRAVAG